MIVAIRRHRCKIRRSATAPVSRLMWRTSVPWMRYRCSRRLPNADYVCPGQVCRVEPSPQIGGESLPDCRRPRNDIWATPDLRLLPPRQPDRCKTDKTVLAGTERSNSNGGQNSQYLLTILCIEQSCITHASYIYVSISSNFWLTRGTYHVFKWS